MRFDIVEQTSASSITRRLVTAPIMATLPFFTGAAELRLGTNIAPGSEPLYLAKSKGFLGSRLKLIPFRSATQVVTALKSGAIDGGTLKLEEALALSSEGVELVIVQVTDISLSGDTLLAQGAAELFSSKLILGEIVAVLVFRADSLTSTANLPLIKALGGAWQRTLEYQQENPDDAQALLQERVEFMVQQGLIAASQPLPVLDPKPIGESR